MSSKSTGKNYMMEKLIKNYTLYLLETTWTYEESHGKPLRSQISGFAYHFPTNLHWQKTYLNHPKSVTSCNMTLWKQVCIIKLKFGQICQDLLTNSDINCPIPQKIWIISYKRVLTTCRNVIWKLHKCQRA